MDITILSSRETLRSMSCRKWYISFLSTLNSISIAFMSDLVIILLVSPLYFVVFRHFVEMLKVFAHNRFLQFEKCLFV